METFKMMPENMLDEALNIAKVLCKLLPANDPGMSLAYRAVGEVRGGFNKISTS